MLLLMLLAAHWIADYPLQGDFLAKAKAEGPLRLYHLTAHSGIHGGAVALVTGSLSLGLLEWVLHTFIDELKVRRRTSFEVDQFLHIVCKLVYFFLIAGLAALAPNPHI
jgi:hypothetical protein